MREQKYTIYTPELKVKVAKAYLSGEYGGYRAVAKKFNVQKNRPHVWAKQLKEFGETYFLSEKRGIKSSGRPKTISYKSMSTEEKLRFKEMECEILKKYHALLKQLGEL